MLCCLSCSVSVYIKIPFQKISILTFTELHYEIFMEFITKQIFFQSNLFRNFLLFVNLLHESKSVQILFLLNAVFARFNNAYIYLYSWFEFKNAIYNTTQVQLTLGRLDSLSST